MSLEVLKAWPSVKQAWQAMHSDVNQIVVAVHVGIDELLELLTQTIGRQDFTELILQRRGERRATINEVLGSLQTLRRRRMYVSVL